MTHKVFYNSHASAEFYALVREAVPSGFELVTLDADDDAERHAKIVDCEVAIVAGYPLRAPLIEAATNLSLVHHQGVGYHDTVDVEALRVRGIALALTTAGTDPSVGEHTVMLMLAACRRLAYADAELRVGRFHVNALRPLMRSIAGMTIGYLGMGRNARATAARLAGFETRGIYFDPGAKLDADEAERLGVASVDSLDALLEASDIVALFIPLTRETHHLLDAKALARMKRGAILVNTARGAVVDENALAAALREGRIAAAGLDVFETEPLPATSPLTQLPNVVLTPHVAAGTRDALKAKLAALFANVQRFYAGRPLEHQVLP